MGGLGVYGFLFGFFLIKTESEVEVLSVCTCASVIFVLVSC